MRIGILTSGGDCPGLNAAIRGVAKAVYEKFPEAEILGIADGYYGLIHGESRLMHPMDFSGILNLGGTILGTSRQPYANMRKIGVDMIDKVASMKDNYHKMQLDCIVILGGNGTHKTAALLAEEGLNVIALPKTIDNDIWGTDVTFGFHTAVQIATDIVDRIHTTAASHRRVMIVEFMGNKAGWLALYAGLAGGADVILIPEIPFDADIVAEKLLHRSSVGKHFSIIAVAEGAVTKEEAPYTRKEIKQMRSLAKAHSVSDMVVKQLKMRMEAELRAVVPGHIQRGGPPSPYDRVLSTQFGVYAAQLIEEGIFGVTVALSGNAVIHNPLSEVAGKTKLVPADSQMVDVARRMGITFGDH